MSVATRIGCLLAIVLALFAVGSAASVQAAGPPAGQINLGDIFGNENEPDENEPEEGGSARAAESEEGSGPSVAVILLLVILGLVAARVALFYFRLRRRVRNEGWLSVVLGSRWPARGSTEAGLIGSKASAERRRRSE
jgi:hypothetical protein